MNKSFYEILGYDNLIRFIRCPLTQYMLIEVENLEKVDYNSLEELNINVRCSLNEGIIILKSENGFQEVKNLKVVI